VQQILSSGKGCTITEIADRLPDLRGRDDAEEILYLLLRLDKRFENDGDRWFTKIGVKLSPVLEIREAVESFLRRKIRKAN